MPPYHPNHASAGKRKLPVDPDDIDDETFAALSLQHRDHREKGHEAPPHGQMHPGHPGWVTLRPPPPSHGCAGTFFSAEEQEGC
jgi:hypothetical protein